MENIRIFSRKNNRTNKVVWCYSFEGRKKEVIVNGTTQYKRTRISKSGFKTRAEAQKAGAEHIAYYFTNKPSNDWRSYTGTKARRNKRIV